MKRLSVALTVLGVLALIGASSPSRQALACSLGTANLEQSAQYAEYIVVGEVVAETEKVIGSPEPTLPQYARSYKSTVQVAAALKGDPPRPLTIGDLGQLGADCSGGPRLKAGERLLLFVSHYRSPAGGEAQQLFIPGWDGGKYVLTGGYATSAFAEPASWPVEDAVRTAARIAGSPPAELEAALAFARGEAPPAEVAPSVTDSDSDSDPSAVVIALAAAGAVVAIVTAFIAFRYWRRTDR